MNGHERLNAALEPFASQSQLEVDQIATTPDVSTATIRRNLDHFEQQQLVMRTRGSAVANGVAYDLPLRHKTAHRAPKKQHIAQLAAGPRRERQGRRSQRRHEDHGGRLRAGDATAPRRHTTIVSDRRDERANLAYEVTVRARFKIVVTGGVARPQPYGLVEPLAARALEDVTLDIAFIGVVGLDPDLDATAYDEGEPEINGLLALRARRVVVVADASKLGRRAFARVCPIGTPNRRDAGDAPGSRAHQCARLASSRLSSAGLRQTRSTS
jgi:DeoR family transcriptional regulator of aga operon